MFYGFMYVNLIQLIFQNMHGHVNGGFHRNGSVRSGTDCHGVAGGAGGHNHHSLEHSYKVKRKQSFYFLYDVKLFVDENNYHHIYISAFAQDHLPLYPDMDNTRGKVNIVIFSGEYICTHIMSRISWE